MKQELYFGVLAIEQVTKNLPWVCFLGEAGVDNAVDANRSLSRSFSLLNWFTNFAGGLIGKNEGEGSPNWWSSNDPEPVDWVELEPV